MNFGSCSRRAVSSTQRIANQVERAGFELDRRRLDVAHVGLQPVQVRLARLPVVRVAFERQVVALDPLLEDERSGADRFGLLGSGLDVDRLLVEHVQVLEEVEQRRPRAVRLEDDGVLVRACRWW